MALSGYGTFNSVINSSTNTTSYSGSLTGVTAGDLLVFFCHGLGDTGANTPASWTVHCDYGGGNTENATYLDGIGSTGLLLDGGIYYIQAGYSGNPTITVTTSAGMRSMKCMALIIQGHDTTTPIANYGQNNSNTSQGTSNTSPSGHTTAADGNVVVGYVAIKGGDITGLAVTGADGSQTGQSGGTASNDHEWGHAYDYTPTAASVSFAWSWTGTDYNIAQWVEIAVASSGSTVQGAGTAAGTGAATGVGASTAASAGTSTGTGAATAVGASTATSAGTSAGTGSASAVGTGIAASTGTAAGVGSASAVGKASTGSTGSAAGTSTAAATGAATAAATGASAGTGAATGAAASTAASTGAAAGTGAASGVGASTASAAGSAAGTGSASGVGNAIAAGQAVGSAAGTSTAAGVGASTAAATGTAAGTSSASAVAYVAPSETTTYQPGWGGYQGDADEGARRAERDRRITDKARREAVRRAIEGLEDKPAPEEQISQPVARQVAKAAVDLIGPIPAAEMSAAIDRIEAMVARVWAEMQAEAMRQQAWAMMADIEQRIQASEARQRQMMLDDEDAVILMLVA